MKISSHFLWNHTSFCSCDQELEEFPNLSPWTPLKPPRFEKKKAWFFLSNSVWNEKDHRFSYIPSLTKQPSKLSIFLHADTELNGVGTLTTNQIGEISVLRAVSGGLNWSQRSSKFMFMFILWHCYLIGGGASNWYPPFELIFCSQLGFIM